MNLRDFIWAQQGFPKYVRHIVFWLSIYLFLIISILIAVLAKENFEWRDLIPRFKTRFMVLLTCMAYTYTVVYYLLPKFFYKKRFTAFGLWVGLLTLLAYALSGFITYTQSGVFKQSNLFTTIWSLTMIFIFNGAPILCCIFLAGKVFKQYFEKMEEKVHLVKENANATLQLLKAQVHPHFLFNTLNNIYSFTLTKSPQAAGLVMKLSGMLKYMTKECEKPLVPLEKELKMLMDYMDLERVRYGDRLKLRVEIKGEYENKLIAPLLLLPFVENCFKHGSSKMLKHPWIRLRIDIEDQRLFFKIANSKPQGLEKINGESGIGLANVQKRLKLLYPGEFQLGIINLNYYEVELKLPIHYAVNQVVAA